MKRTLAITLLLLATVAGAAPLDLADVRTRVANAPDPVAGDEGLVLFEGRYYTHEDGLTTLRVQRLTRVDSEWALERVSDPRIRFDASRQRLDVTTCRSYLPDGGFVDSPVNAFNEVTPGALTLAVDFLDIKELVVTHTGLIPGAILWLDYTLRDIAPAGLPAGHLIFPHGDFPVLEMEIVAEGLYGETVNPEGGLHALPEGEGTWRFRELPAAPGVVHRRGDQLPHVVLSPRDGWEDVLQALGESLEAALTDTTGLDAWLGRLDTQPPFVSEREAMEAWLDGIESDTALLRLDEWHWRRAPRSVARVLETSLATPLERIALLSAAMGTQELTEHWMFPARWRQTGRLLASAALENPLILVSRTEDGPCYLAPCTNRISKGEQLTLHGSFMIGPENRRPDRVPAHGDPGIHIVRLKLHWDLPGNTWRLAGGLSIPERLRVNLEAPETYLRDWLSKDSTQVDELRLIRGIKQFEAGGERPMPTTDDEGLTRIELSTPAVSLAELLPAGMNRSHSGSQTIHYPRQAAYYRLTWILDLPEDIEPLSVTSIGATCPGGSFTCSRELEGNRLTIHYDLEHDGSPVSPADYPAYRDFVNAALDPAATRVILRPREEG